MYNIKNCLLLLLLLIIFNTVSASTFDVTLNDYSGFSFISSNNSNNFKMLGTIDSNLVYISMDETGDILEEKLF